MSNGLRPKKFLLVLALLLCLMPFVSSLTVQAEGGYVQIIDVRRTLGGVTETVTVWDYPSWENRTVEFDEGTNIEIYVYAAHDVGGGPPFYWHLWSSEGVDIQRTTSNYYEEFYPNPDEGDYFAWVDGDTPGMFYVNAVSAGSPDLTVSQARPDDGAASPPFCVGQSVDWYVTITNVGEYERQLQKKTDLLAPLQETNTSCSFSHIFQGGYASGYYSYKWAEILDADAFEFFQETGIFNKDTALLFSTHILSAGGSEHPMELYKRFRGKELRNRCSS